MVTVVGTRGPVWEASQNGVVALIGLSDGRRSRERRAPDHVYMILAGKGLIFRKISYGFKKLREAVKLSE